MDNDLANLIVGNETGKSVYAASQDSYTDLVKDRGIASAVVSYTPFRFGEVMAGGGDTRDFRKFFYNADGRVVKKFDFDDNGDISAKEESIFDKTLKWKLLQTNIITAEDSVVETYEYKVLKGKHKMKKYTFTNPKLPRPKVDLYEHDAFGRISRRTSHGLLGDPELITHYLYDTDNDTKVRYRHVTLPDETLVFTMMYDYDSKKDKQTALYSFMLAPEEVTALRNAGTGWQLESVSRSVWEYDANGNNVLFHRDEKFTPALDMLSAAGENFLPQNNRVITEKTTRDFQKINGKYYLVRETEWLTRMNEPLKAVKDFRYYDSKGKCIYPPGT